MKKKKDILTKYAYYRPYLTLIGRIELNKSVKIEDVGLSRGVIQAGYKEMEEDKFTGNIIHYLCYISQQYLIELARKKTNDSLEITKLIIDDYPFYKEDTLNLLRLFHINPSIYLDEVMSRRNFNSDTKWDVDRYRAFLVLESAWYHLYMFSIYNEDNELWDKLIDEDYLDNTVLEIYNYLKNLMNS